MHEDTRQQPTLASESAPVPASGDDPVLRLQQEYRPEGVRARIRGANHPEELFITGLAVICPNCGARRDWMIICDRPRIDIRCRCAHQWHEPELTRADFENMIDDIPGTLYPSPEAAVRATGYDAYLHRHLPQRAPHRISAA